MHDDYQPREYRPREYWAERLASSFNLRGTGHVSYSEAYNAWLYRAKGRLLRRALEHVALPATALDVGSGTGWAVERLRRWGAAVEGCDLTELAVARLRDRFPALAFFVADWGAVPLPRPDRSYHLVTLLDITYHVVDDEQWASGVHDTARVLEPGGWMVVTDGFGPVDRDAAAHVRFRSERRWRETAGRAGLEMVAVLPYARWLSRDRDIPGFSLLPDGVRGAVEFALESIAPRPALLHGAVLRRSS